MQHPLTIFKQQIRNMVPPGMFLSLILCSMGYPKTKTIVTECSTIFMNLKVVLTILII